MRLETIIIWLAGIWLLGFTVNMIFVLPPFHAESQLNWIIDYIPGFVLSFSLLFITLRRFLHSPQVSLGGRPQNATPDCFLVRSAGTKKGGAKC